MDITSILELVIKLIVLVAGTIFTYYIKPYISQILEDKRYDKTVTIISMLIKTAEQLESQGYFDEIEDVCEAKKNYVLSKASMRLKEIGIKYDADYLSDIIEGYLKSAKSELYWELRTAK